MFKKIIFIGAVLSPLLYSILIGFPVVSDYEFTKKVKSRPNIAVSKRCFGVGDFREFRICWGKSDRIKGLDLALEVIDKTNEVSFLFTILIIVSLVLHIILSIIILV